MTHFEAALSTSHRVGTEQERTARVGWQFLAASGAKHLTQTGYLAYPAADGDWFDLFDVPMISKSSLVGRFIGSLKEF